MIRTQIQLTEKQARTLKGLARREGVSLAEMIRRCIDRTIEEREPDTASLYDAAAGLIGQFRDRRRVTDLAEKHDDYLDEDGTE
jgi:hypothetical protein